LVLPFIYVFFYSGSLSLILHFNLNCIFSEEKWIHLSESLLSHLLMIPLRRQKHSRGQLYDDGWGACWKSEVLMCLLLLIIILGIRIKQVRPMQGRLGRPAAARWKFVSTTRIATKAFLILILYSLQSFGAKSYLYITD